MSDAVIAPAAAGKRKVYRHRLVVRLTHWVNAICIFFLVGSGLQIFNAHPALYWGEASTFNENNLPVDTFLTIGTYLDANGEPRGFTQLMGGDFIDTTGFLGLSQYRGEEVQRAFPSWLTIPSWRDLAAGRLWHFFFAWIFVINGMVYVVYGLAGRHIWRDLVPARDQWRQFGRTILDHLRLRFPHGREALRYNILQKLAYLVVIVALILMVVTGLCMSPGLNASVPWLPELFGGRQSARTIHFISATIVVLFVVVHIVLVLISGFWNNIRSMITGRYVIKEEKAHELPRLLLSRRKFLTASALGAGSLALAGCDNLSEPGSGFRGVLDRTDELTEAVQRLLIGDQRLAREFSEAEISRYFRANGNTEVRDPAYNQLAANGFADYRLTVTGLVDNPLSLSLDDLRVRTARTQITRHDCVEGWSCIGQWTGPQLGPILAEAGLQSRAKYVVFYCYDDFGATLSGPIRYYESLGLIDAFHPQTILAYEMNGQPLPIPHGAPVRLRVERQLGYKMPKFLRAIEVVETFANIGRGRGGYYEDGDGYEWYAGI